MEYEIIFDRSRKEGGFYETFFLRLPCAGLGGCLGYLSRRFDGDATKIVCAYHAGQGNVDSWLKNPQYSADGVTLDVIPTQDTATYASRVLRARDVYRKYYFPVETPEPTES